MICFILFQEECDLLSFNRKKVKHIDELIIESNNCYMGIEMGVFFSEE